MVLNIETLHNEEREPKEELLKRPRELPELTMNTTNNLLFNNELFVVFIVSSGSSLGLFSSSSFGSQVSGEF